MLPSCAVIGPANGELVVEISPSSLAISAWVSAPTIVPYLDCLNGLVPSFRPVRKLALYFEPVNFPASVVSTMSLYSAAQSHSEPVTQPFGASDEASAW